ncbi:Fic family protein [Candidatus Daviesbacteria bacterium]|nr:Fic family protein [Candidatus Daviesbacteria bacterium]
MLIPPKYILTNKISQLLSSIEASKEVINSIEIPKELETNIRRKSTLKSSLFSARIEGNTLRLDELPKTSSKSQKLKEVFNILKALNWVYVRRSKDLKLQDILRLHKVVMADLASKQDVGKFRTEVGAIFNSAGIAIYLPPRPSQILPLIKILIKFANSKKEQFAPIKAALVHLSFEKIHPFLDGNGRVGRLLLQAVLQKEGYGMKGILPLEEYLDNHRSEYYTVLESSEKDVTDYVEFILEAIAETAKEVKEQFLKKDELKVEDILLPRRAEILNIIKEHRMVNFDTLRRRFLSVNERTLRYDLKKLSDAGLIKKRGTTKGVYYEVS